MRGIFSLGQNREERKISKILFLIGLFTSTYINIGGYTSISELVLVMMMPIMLVKNFRFFVNDQCATIVWLLILWMVGVVVSDIYNHNSFPFFVRGFIPPLGMLSALIVIYPLLRKHPEGLRWILMGVALSNIISIFAFQSGAVQGSSEVLSGSVSASDAVIGYKLFWVGKLNEWLSLPIKGWYMSMPHGLNVAIAIFLSIFGLASGGRSAFMYGFVTVLFLFLGGKSRTHMTWLKKCWPIVLVAFLLLFPVIKFVYKEAATRGLMGDEEQDKYELQAKGHSALETLIAGRGEFFIALSAIKDKPLIGHGSHALDTKGYIIDHVSKYGMSKDLENAIRLEQIRGIRTIPAHSHIAEYWMWAGIAGLLPWLFILGLFARTLFTRMHVYPPYYGYLAIVLPSMFWHIFFSPLGSRIGMALTIAVCLVVRSMRYDQRRYAGTIVKSW